MKPIFLLLIVIHFSILGSVFAQTDTLEILDNDLVNTDGFLQPTENNNFNETKKVKLQPHITAGSFFTTSPGSYNAFGYYVAPGISYDLTKRFTVSAGIGLSNTTYFPLGESAANTAGFKPMTQMYLYASGSYLLTNRLVVTGSAYKVINNYVPNRNLQNNTTPGYNSQGMSLGLEYKLSKSFSVGFQMRTQDSDYNYFPQYPTNKMSFPGMW